MEINGIINEGRMLLEILCQKHSFQKHWVIYIICVSWLLMCILYEALNSFEPYIVYGVPVLICGVNTIVVLVNIIRIMKLLKIGKQVKCKIIYSI